MAIIYKLENAAAANARSPKTFKIPPAEALETLWPRDLAKLVFRISDGNCGFRDETQRSKASGALARDHGYTESDPMKSLREFPRPNRISS